MKYLKSLLLIIGLFLTTSLAQAAVPEALINAVENTIKADF